MDLVAALSLYLTLFHPPGPDITEVEIAADEYQKIEQTYTQELEQGYCLFGNIQQEEVAVEQVIHTDYPIPWTHSKHRIDFTCIPELIQQSPAIIEPRHRFIGAVHTHPSGNPEPSTADEFWIEATSPFQRIHGIYNGHTLQFYRSKTLDQPARINVRTQ